MIQRTVAGVQVDDETLAVDEIIDAGAGGHYLRRKHTLRHCREMIRPDLFVPDVLDNWIAAGRKDLQTRATELYRELKKGLAAAAAARRREARHGQRRQGGRQGAGRLRAGGSAGGRRCAARRQPTDTLEERWRLTACRRQ